MINLANIYGLTFAVITEQALIRDATKKKNKSQLQTPHRKKIWWAQHQARPASSSTVPNTVAKGYTSVIASSELGLSSAALVRTVPKAMTGRSWA